MAGGKLKGYLMAALMLLIIIMLVAAFLPDIQSETSAIADNTSYATMTRTIFGLAGWVPIVLIMVGVITAGLGLGSAVRARRGRRRRR